MRYISGEAEALQILLELGTCGRSPISADIESDNWVPKVRIPRLTR